VNHFQSFAELAGPEFLTAMIGTIDEFLLLPWPIVVAALFTPTLIAIGSRSAYGVFCAALLDCMVIAALIAANGENGGYVATGRGVAAALWPLSIVAAAYAFHDRRRATHLAVIEDRLVQLREEMASYLAALDQRAQLIDEVALMDPSKLRPGQ
jgi:hypothetical protein